VNLQRYPVWEKGHPENPGPASHREKWIEVSPAFGNLIGKEVDRNQENQTKLEKGYGNKETRRF